MHNDLIVMTNSHIFISHSAKDDTFVKGLREELEALGIKTWVDSRELIGGSKLTPEIEKAIESARQFVVVLSTNTINSPWVRKEIRKALEVEQRRQGEGYRVVPLLIPGVEPSSLGLWFDEEPVAVPVCMESGEISEMLPALLAALGERLPDDWQPHADVAARPVEELILRLSDLQFVEEEGVRRARAIAQLVYEPADKAARSVESRRFVFTAPLGVLEAEELRWYLEEYFVWPVGQFKKRAARVEAKLPKWGRELYQTSLALPVSQEAFAAWGLDGAEGERRFSVFVERDLPEGTDGEGQSSASGAAAELLSLPWELLHDGRGFLFHGRHPVRVRRRLPNRHRQSFRTVRLPIRVLLISPRPEEDGVAYIDHRVSALPLVEAFEGLGELVRFTALNPPTFAALEETLRKADETGEHFDVVHFDGHGVYDPKVGLGALCFEDPNDADKLTGRAMELIYSGKLAEIVRDYRIPLVFLEACQSAKTEVDPTASVAARLLEEGVTSVVAMSHTVLVETARRFVRAFYHELAQGKRVGAAMLSGQQALYSDSYRGRMLGAGELRLQDWFVPVLYQEEQDPQLVAKLPAQQVRQLEGVKRRLSLGALPAPPEHEFIGRGRELLALERLLHIEPWAVVRGQGGEGKTTLAAELARWLVRLARFRRAAFVSLEHYTDARGVLDSVGRQLLPEGYSVSNYPNLKQALKPVKRALTDFSTIIVLDNLESILPDTTSGLLLSSAPVEELFRLCQRLMESSPMTRLLFTTREPMPSPFNNKQREFLLGALSHEDAIRLVGEVMKREGLELKATDAGGDPQEIVELVDAVGCHARALVLLAREVARQGVKASTENLLRIMAELQEQFPGDRENSLYASVELSLRHLPPLAREQIRSLVAVQGGVHVDVFKKMLGVDEETVFGLLRQLIDVGLAQQMEYGHFRIDPAMPSYLQRELVEVEREEGTLRWIDAMGEFTFHLYQQLFKDARIASRLTQLELPNLMSLLILLEERTTPELVVETANRIEMLLSQLGHPQALARAIIAREKAAQRLTGWSSAAYSAESAHVDRLVERRETHEAVAAAQQLLQRCIDAGVDAYPTAPYDTATAHYRLGRVLYWNGDADAALTQVNEAQRQLQELAHAGNAHAERMLAVTAATIGDCLRQLGRLEKAADAYQKAINQAKSCKDTRQVMTSMNNLGIVRSEQGRITEAMHIFNEVLPMVEDLEEPRNVAMVLRQIGEAYESVGQVEQAESILRRALAIQVQHQDLAGEAEIMTQLGIMYDKAGQLEDAVNCGQRAAEIFVKLCYQMAEGAVRNNLGITFLRLRQLEDARRELLRAVECSKAYGHSGRLWNTWGHLYSLEKAVGNLQAAAHARQQAIESYMAYRRDGGETLAPGAAICALTVEAIRQKNVTELELQFVARSGAATHPAEKVLISKLQTLLQGNIDPALADDNNLDHRDAVELLLLLEAIEGKRLTPAAIGHAEK
jgi:tetratricopeptide (TPR) repeat protein